jgi:hypothetical protein
MGWLESYTLPTRYAMLPVAGVASAVLTVTLLIACVPMWRDAAWWKRGRIGRTIVLAAAIVFIRWLGYWRLIGAPF